MIRYKIDVLSELSKIGWSQAKLRKYGIFGNSTIDRFRKFEPVGFDALGVVCGLLHLQPGDIIENIVTDQEKILLYDLNAVFPFKGVTGLNKDVSSGDKGNIPSSAESGSNGLVAAPGATKRKRGRPRKTVNNNIDTV